jgi:hypothetical protein
MKYIHTWLFRLVIMVALVAGFAAAPAAFAQNSMAMVRVVHASPDAPAVDVYVNGDIVDPLTNVPFFTASSYLELPAGEHQIQVAPTDTSADDAVIDATVTLEADAAYTVAATGMLEDIQATLIEDDLSATPEGEARVGVYHFSPDAPAVDVKLADGTALVEGLAFPDGGAISVPAGTYDIEVTPAGADDVVLDLSGTTFEEGVFYSVFANDELENISAEVTTTSVSAEAAASTTSDTQPAASDSSAQQGSAPHSLPNTAEGETMPLNLLILAAVALLGSGALTLALRRKMG